MAGRSPQTRRRNYTPATPPEVPDNRAMLERMMSEPGNTLDAYNRFRSPPYSIRNIAWLMIQGAKAEPHGPYKFWPTVDRHVMRGQSGLWINRPVTVKSKDQFDSDGNPKTFTKFVQIKGAWGLSQTEGAPLPEIGTREWKLARALGQLSVTEVPFLGTFDGNMAGFSHDRNMAVSPVAPNRLKTAVHELGHIVCGHTTEKTHDEYLNHRGAFEFEAEATAYLVLHELDAMDDRTDMISRGYVQTWMQGEKPSEDSFKRVFRAADTILRAGYEEPTLALGVA